MTKNISNRQRVLSALARKHDPHDLPFLPWGVDGLAPPFNASYAPLFDLLRERAVIKRRWTGSRHDLFQPSSPVRREAQRSVRSDGVVIDEVRLSGPGGELTSTRQSIPGTTASETISRFLKSAADVETYLSWPYVDDPVDVSSYFELDRDLGDRGVVTHRISDALGIVGAHFEPEPFALCSVESMDVVLALLDAIAGRVFRQIERVLQAGARPIFILQGPEFATPPLLSPHHFDEYVTRFDRPLIDLIHRYGCPVIVHCHGRLNAVLERFADMGADGLHPLETIPMGDVTLADAARRVSDRICFVGALQIGDMMIADPEEIRRQVRAIREQVPAGMILSTSATPYETPMPSRLLANYAAALDAADGSL